MTNTELTSVGLKVFAIFVAIKAVAMLPLVSAMAASYGLQSGFVRGEVFCWLVGIAALISLLVLSVLIWKLSSRVVNKIQTPPTSKHEPSPIDGAFLLSLLGIYLTVQGLQQVGMTMSNTLQLLNSHVDVTAQTVTRIVSDVFGLVVGISLVVRSSAWMRFLRWLRVAGLKEES